MVAEVHDELIRLFEDGRIDPVLSKVAAFRVLPEALESLEDRSSYGKVVLSLGEAAVGPLVQPQG
jgi:NADPH:quinone reductase